MYFHSLSLVFDCLALEISSPLTALTALALSF